LLHRLDDLRRVARIRRTAGLRCTGRNSSMNKRWAAFTSST
jgi:hypothetical protein